MRKTNYILACIGLLCSLSSYSFAQQSPLTHAEQMPYFPGCTTYEKDSAEKRQCSNENLIQYISNHIEYPDSAKQEGIEGTVLVQFVIDERGKITDALVLRDIGGGCGEAALKVLQGMPAWEPAKDKGEYVKVKLNLPIQFFFKGGEEGESELFTVNWGKLSGRKVSKASLMEQLERNVIVRDPFGNAKPITELIFACEKRKSYKEKKSRGSINREMRNFVKKVKKNSEFSIIAVVQHEGSFVYVRKSYAVVD